jgi:hypothetical protein
MSNLRRVLGVIVSLLIAIPMWSQDLNSVISVTNLGDKIENYTGVAHALAPNGTMVAYSTQIDNGDERVRSLCIYIFTEETANCTAFPTKSEIWRADRLVWSPDSRKIAMTEDLFQRLDEPDIWMFDLDTQTFDNLTDDGTTESLEDGIGGTVDYFPVWHPLSGDLYFLRSEGSSERANSIQRIPAGSSDAELFITLADYFVESSVTSPPAISPDGTNMAIGLKNMGSSDDRGGLYLIDLNTGNIEESIQLSEIPTGTYADLDGQVQEDFWNLNPLSIAWIDNESLLIMRADFMSEDIPAAPYAVINLVSHTALPLIDLSDFTAFDLFSQNDELGISYFAYFPLFVLLSSDKRTVYYESNASFSDNQLLLALPTSPNGNNEPVPIIQANLPDTIGMPRYEFITHVSDDGRFGLYKGYYLIEFIVDGSD